MGSKMQTGLLLIIGVIVAAVGWFGIYPADGATDAADQAADLMADPNLAKVGVLMGFGGMIALFIGLLNIARGMATAGGPGSSCANISTILIMAMITAMAISAGLELGTIEATSAASGASLMGISVAVGSSMQLVMGVALTLLAVGIALDKNLHLIGAAVLAIAGVVLLVSARPFVDVEPLLYVGWISLMVSGLLLGGLTLKSNT